MTAAAGIDATGPALPVVPVAPLGLTQVVVAPPAPIASPICILPAPSPACQIQPVADVASYLLLRKSQPDPEQESSLFITLPVKERDQVAITLRAIALVNTYVKRDKMSVHAACKKVVVVYADQYWSAKRFEARYAAFTKKQDWVVLVNRSKAGLAWQDSDRGLPAGFLKFYASVRRRYKRKDAGREALREVKRQWSTGRNSAGKMEPIPGYGFWREWFKRTNPDALVVPLTAPIPPGWSPSNIARQIQKAAILKKSILMLSIRGHPQPPRSIFPRCA